MPTATVPASAEPSKSFRSSIPKWPFIAGDVMLIGVALALSTTAGAMSEMLEIFCLGAVGLGGILLATPFVLETFPPSAWRMFSGSRPAAASGPDGLTETELRRQARAAAEAVEHAARANAALEASARRFDARFSPIAELQKGFETALAELREVAAARQTSAAAEAQAFQREMDRLRKEQAEKFKAAEAKIIALEESQAVIVGYLKTIIERPVVTTSLAPAATTPARARKVAAAAPVEAPVAVAAPVLVTAGGESEGGVAVAEAPTPLGSISAASAENFAPAPVEAAPAESETSNAKPEAATIEPDSMLAKALATAQLAAEAPAVAGIIQSRSRRSRKSKPHLSLDAVSAPVAVESVAPVEEPAAVAPAEVAPAPVESSPAAAPEVLPEAASTTAETPAAIAPAPVEAPEESASSLRRSARAKAVALRGDDDDEKATPTIFTPPPTEAGNPADGPTQGELLAREAETIRRKRATKSPLHLPTLNVRVLIGIGNKPFVRGNGPGLSPDKGVPMEFVEIGQWRWVAPKDAAAPITLTILKNDEVPAEGGAITLKPGETLDISPVFPA